MSDSNEVLWLLTQRSRKLQEFRQSSRAAWNDEAARELELRYLNPHEESARAALGGLQKQAAGIEAAKKRLQLAAARAIEASDIGDEVEELLKEAGYEASVARQLDETARDRVTAAQELLPKVASALTQAAHACDGVPDS